MSDTRSGTITTQQAAIAGVRREADDPTALLERARHGDAEAWDALVERYTALLWSVARSHRLTTADAADVVQTTWLRLLQHADRIHDPERLASWLGTTVRRECWRLRHKAGRELPSEVEQVDADDRTPEDDVLAADRDARVRAAITSLPRHYRVLLQALTAEPAPSYAEVAELLDLPIGSIGPMRGRALRLLREHPLLAADVAAA